MSQFWLSSLVYIKLWIELHNMTIYIPLEGATNGPALISYLNTLDMPQQIIICVNSHLIQSIKDTINK